MRSGVAQALRPRVWHDCALFFFDLGISYFAGFGTRLGRILAVQNQINPFYAFFHFCTLSFARDTPILLRDADFDVFFRVTARWVK